MATPRQLGQLTFWIILSFILLGKATKWKYFGLFDWFKNIDKEAEEEYRRKNKIK